MLYNIILDFITFSILFTSSLFEDFVFLKIVSQCNVCTIKCISE